MEEDERSLEARADPDSARRLATLFWEVEAAHGLAHHQQPLQITVWYGLAN